MVLDHSYIIRIPISCSIACRLNIFKSALHICKKLWQTWCKNRSLHWWQWQRVVNKSSKLAFGLDTFKHQFCRVNDVCNKKNLCWNQFQLNIFDSTYRKRNMTVCCRLPLHLYSVHKRNIQALQFLDMHGFTMVDNGEFAKSYCYFLFYLLSSLCSDQYWYLIIYLYYCKCQ